MRHLNKGNRFADELEELLGCMEIEKGKESELEEMKKHLRRYVIIQQAFNEVPDELFKLCVAHCAMYTSNLGNVFMFKVGLKDDPDDEYIWEVITPISSVNIDSGFSTWDVTDFLEEYLIDPLDNGILLPLFMFIDSIYLDNEPLFIYDLHEEGIYTCQIAVGEHTLTTIRFNEANRLRFEVEAAKILTCH